MLDAQNPAWERARIFSDGTADHWTRDGNVVRMFAFFGEICASGAVDVTLVKLSWRSSTENRTIRSDISR